MPLAGMVGRWAGKTQAQETSLLPPKIRNYRNKAGHLHRPGLMAGYRRLFGVFNDHYGKTLSSMFQKEMAAIQNITARQRSPRT
jgi:hypothetical protein